MDFQKDILNVKNATRMMTAEEFDEKLPWMAEELAKIDFHYKYTEEDLKRAWKNLKAFNSDSHYTASQQRRGMELCEYFFPNFFDIKGANGKGFKDYWNAKDLQKIIKWNKTSHTTPYLSEFRRGVYFCYGLTKNTMFRPHLAKMICDYYSPEIVFDPCCGWGGRMLGTVASGANYIGFEPCKETYHHLLELADFLGITDKVSIYNLPAEAIPAGEIKADLVLTSPPYYNQEVYSDEDTQSYVKFKNYKDWVDGWLNPIITKCCTIIGTNGVSCWNVSPKMREDVNNIHVSLGWKYDSDFGLNSSARPANQNALHDKKTKDMTICYKNFGTKKVIDNL